MKTLKGDVNRVSERNSSGIDDAPTLNGEGVKRFTLIEKLISANSSTTHQPSIDIPKDPKWSASAGVSRPRLVLGRPRPRIQQTMHITTPPSAFPSIFGEPQRRKEFKSERKSLNFGGLSENVVLSTQDAEREAQLLYEKSLKQFHDSVKAEQENDANDVITVSKNDSEIQNALSSQSSASSVCNFWIQKHCQCSTILKRLSITCRNIGILAVPVNLPADTITL